MSVNCTTQQIDITQQRQTNDVVAALAQTQAALSTAVTARRAAEVRLKRCKTRTSPAAKQHQAEVQVQQIFAESLQKSVHELSRQPEAAALAARFGDRPLSKYVVKNEHGRELLDVLRINEVRIAFFRFAIDAGANWLDTGTTYFFDEPVTNVRYLLEVK